MFVKVERGDVISITFREKEKTLIHFSKMLTIESTASPAIVSFVDYDDRGELTRIGILYGALVKPFGGPTDNPAPWIYGEKALIDKNEILELHILSSYEKVSPDKIAELNKYIKNYYNILEDAIKKKEGGKK